MRSETGLEALLRPPVEWYSAFVLLVVAAIAVLTPWALMMPWHMALVVAAIAGYAGWTRLREGLRIVRYHHNLKYYPVTRIAPHKIPVGPGEFYLGEGFAWTQQHTQRVHEARRPDAKPYVTQSAREIALRNWGAKVQEGNSRLLKRLTGFDHWLNPFKPYPDLGGSPVLHGVGSIDERPVKMRQSSRNGHMVVMGTTRVGKTRLLEMLATQDIHAGHVVIIIDPKGDADLMLRVQAEARRAGRLEQLYLFHLGYPEISARYNGIGSFSRITEVATRATNALPSSGNSAAFKEFSWRFTNIVAQAQVALGRIPTYETLLHDVTGIEPLFLEYVTWYYANQAINHQRFVDFKDKIEVLKALAESKKLQGVDKTLQNRAPEVIAMAVWIRESKATDNVLLGLLGAVSYDRSFYEKIIASLGPFLEKLISGQVGKLISPDYLDPDDDRPIFDWMTVMRQGGIVYAGLDALSDSVVSAAVGNSMLSDLVSVGGKLYKTGLDPHHPEGKISLPKVCCHFDEVNEIAGPEFVPMVNKLGGSGFQITAYTQSFFDIESKVGDKAKAGQIFDNFNHVVMLRVRSITTANLVAEQMPEVDVVHLTPVSGVTDSAAQGGADFTSRNDDILTSVKMPMIAASDILKLPQGQAIALLEGNRAYKIRIPLADTTNDPFVPESLKKVAQDMKRRYRTSESWAAETDWLGGQPVGPGLIDDTLAEETETAADADDAAAHGSDTAVVTTIDQRGA
ncbi:conjugative coupling factor TraD, PFGI-1 class [Corticibacter populi]|uniref:Conjugative coupling factor TraD, PFGI-1 class n=1 Tax=Corticibacter populi TaxID=1550736 RepID=A0A3M6QZU7_9BURK|nr:type IV conjugative transfer system coupling protein TraD [Corticibacter populi]RMX08139.1 conjugative coupling factor TraD, PFGI-1 class [Corticibacter populi]RZS35394.1 conjugative coupling factor TraD (TOL family) [Corticibacter populi]